MKIVPNLALAALLSASSLPALAQLATPPASEPATAAEASQSDRTITLSPFEVDTSKDHGYSATNTQAGSRLNTRLLDTPSAIEVMTPEFLHDVGAVNINDAITLGENSAVNRNDDNGGYLIRGIESSANRSRNLFEVSGDQVMAASDLYNVDRVTISRGPNAILFGNADPSGVVDISTYKADVNREIGQVEMRGDDGDGRRISGDYNAVLIPERLAIRFDTMYQDIFGFRAQSPERDKNGYITATAVLVKKENYTLTLQADMEDDKGTFAYERVNQFDQQFAYWQANGSPAVGAYSTTTKPVYPAGTSALSSSVYTVWVGSGNGSVAPMNWQNAGVGQANQVADPNLGGKLISETDPVVSKKVWPLYTNLYGVNAGREDDSARYRTLSLTQEFFKNLYVQAAYNDFLGHKWRPWSSSGFTNILVDPNTFLPNGSPNPNYGSPYIERNLQPQNYTFIDSTYRFGVTYKLDLTKVNPWLGTHNLVGSYDYRKSGRYIDNYNEVNLTPLPGALATGAYLASSTNYIYRRFYLNPAAGVVSAGDITTPIVGGGVVGALLPVRAPTVTQTRDGSFSEALQSFWLKDRLVTTVGFRQDSANLYQGGTANQANALGVYPLATTLLNPVPVAKDISDTKSYGGVLHVIGDAVSVYANKSDNFSPAAARHDIFGNLIPPSTGSGQDYGLKFQFFGGRLSLNLGVYKSNAINSVTVGNGGTAVDDDYVTAIWNGIGEPANSVRRPGGALGSQYNYTNNYGAKGYEMEMTYNPTPDWRIRLSVDKNKTVYTAFSPQLQAYYNQYIGVWSQPQYQSIVTSYNSAGSNTIAQQIVLLQNQIALATATTGTGLLSIPYQGNVVSTYDFPMDSFMAHFFIGGSETFSGAAIIGYPNRSGVAGNVAIYDTTKPLYGRDVYTSNVWAGYTRKLGYHNILWRLQLNVSNLLDDEKVIPIRRRPADGVADEVQLRAPRRIALENTFSF